MSSNVDMQFSFLGVISMKIHCSDKDSALFSDNDPATKKNIFPIVMWEETMRYYYLHIISNTMI